MAVGEHITSEIVGLDKLERALKRLPAKVAQNTLRKAATFATTPLLNAARAEAPVRFGTLRESLAKKVKLYRRVGTVVAMVGVRVNFDRFYSGRQQIPNLYARRIIFGAKNQAPNRFLERAHKRTRSEMRRRFFQKARNEIARDIRRARAGA